MYLVISIGMMVTGVLFLFQAKRMDVGSDDEKSQAYDSSRLVELKLKQKKTLRKMGFLSIVLGAALMTVYFIYFD